MPYPTEYPLNWPDYWGSRNIEFLSPREDLSSGLGAIGQLPSAISLNAFLRHITQSLQIPALRYAGNPDSSVETVAVCGGSGSSFLDKAMLAGADAFVTADITYHQFFNVLTPEGLPRMTLIDAGHYETEKHTEQLLCDWLTERFPRVQFVRTSTRTSPVHVFIE